MNLGLHNKKFANQRAKKNLVNMGIPALDLSSLKHVKDFKDWYGYSQKLEHAIRLLREKNDALEKDGDMKELHILKLEKQVEGLQEQIKNYAEQNRILNEKCQDMLDKNYKSQRAQDLEPIFKPIHSKTMSLVGMLKQYATGGASNEATERFSPLKRERGQLLDQDGNSRQTRRRSQERRGEKGHHKRNQNQLQMICDLGENENEEESEVAVEMLGLKDINDMGPPELPKLNDLPKADTSFGEMQENEKVAEIPDVNNYSAQPKPPRRQRKAPSGIKLGGLSLDIDQIN